MKRWKESTSALRSDERSDGGRTPDCVPVRRQQSVWKRDTRVRRWTADVTSTEGQSLASVPLLDCVERESFKQN